MARTTIFRSKTASLVAGLLAAAIPAVVAAQAAVPETHTVRPGDTLWGLAREYLGDPLLWPEIYRQNTLVVEDPHWIYPGEVLRLSGTAPEVSAVPAAPEPAAQAPAPAEAPAPTEGAAAIAATPTQEAAPAPAEAAAPAVQEQQPEQVAEQVEEPPYLPPPTEETADTGSLFPHSMGHPDWTDIRQAFRDSYRPLTKSMFYSSGWLTENRRLPLGHLVGYVTPIEIRADDRRNAMLFTKILVAPPNGAQYQVGDTLLVVVMGRDVERWGSIVQPTGLARVIQLDKSGPVAEVIAQFGPIRPNQNVLPIEKFPEFGNVRAVPISDGVQGHIVAQKDRKDLVGPNDVVYIDKGAKDGVALGDFFEAKRAAGVAGASEDAVPQVMAMFQVVHVNEHTASVITTSVNTAAIPTGTNVRQVAKLPS
jgi:hypothetical protein